MNKNLIVICRDEKQQKDLFEICSKVASLEKNITVYCLLYNAIVDLPSSVWSDPTLTVSFNSEFVLPIRRGHVIKTCSMDKLDQQTIFLKHKIPTPFSSPFKFGMFLDPILFGDYVILKPAREENSSNAIYTKVFRRTTLQNKTPNDFLANHPINKVEMMVQRFVNTGVNPSYYRVSTFLGKCINAWYSKSIVDSYPLETSSDEELEKKIIDVHEKTTGKERSFIHDRKIIELGERVHSAFSNLPLLGVDIVCDINTGEPFVLECNPGGNTWHFSSALAERFRKGFGNAEINGVEKANQIARKMFIEQFDAFDIIAKRLIEVTHELAT